jgi:hypothetical protein
MSKDRSLKTSEDLLKCKKTGELFTDIDNVAGGITTHIKKIYPEFVIESSFKRRKFEKETGNKWYGHFFEKIKNKNISETMKCAYCDWETFDLDNKTGAYTVHLSNKHNITLDKHINNYPEERHLSTTYFNKVDKNNIKLSNEDNYVICEECGEKFSYLNYSHLKTHGLTHEQYRQKYPNSIYISEDFHKKITNIKK